MIRNNDHHATPEQIGENIPKGTVKHTKRNANQRSYQRFPCRKVSFLCRGKGVLQKIKENHTGYPAELWHIKDLRRFRKQKQIQRPVKRAKGKAAVKTGQQETGLFSIFQIPDTTQTKASRVTANWKRLLISSIPIVPLLFLRLLLFVQLADAEAQNSHATINV